MRAKGERLTAQAVFIRTTGRPPRPTLELLPRAMTRKELHRWVRSRFGDRAAYWPAEKPTADLYPAHAGGHRFAEGADCLDCGWPSTAGKPEQAQ